MQKKKKNKMEDIRYDLLEILEFLLNKSIERNDNYNLKDNVKHLKLLNIEKDLNNFILNTKINGKFDNIDMQISVIFFFY